MTVKDMGDIAAGGAAVGSYVSWLPEIAAALAIVWTLIRIYEWAEARICGRKFGGGSE